MKHKWFFLPPENFDESVRPNQWRGGRVRYYYNHADQYKGYAWLHFEKQHQILSRILFLLAFLLAVFLYFDFLESRVHVNWHDFFQSWTSYLDIFVLNGLALLMLLLLATLIVFIPLNYIENQVYFKQFPYKGNQYTNGWLILYSIKYFLQSVSTCMLYIYLFPLLMILVMFI